MSSAPASAVTNNSPMQLLRRQGSAIPQALAVSALLQLEGVFWYFKAFLESWLRTRFFCTAEVQNSHWLIRWLSAQPSAQKAREFIVEHVTATNSEGGARVHAQPAVSLVTWFICDVLTGKTRPLSARSLLDLFWSKYVKRTTDRSLSIISYTQHEEYHGMNNCPTSRTLLRMITRDRAKLEQLLCTLRGADEELMSDQTTIWEARDGEWEESNSRLKKPWSSVCLAPGKSEAMLADAENFWTEETCNWYHKRSLAHRRGYILYGPPGSGKSSTVQALAGQLNLDLHILPLSAPGLDDTTLGTLTREADGILLLEDLDSLFVERTKEDGMANGVSFSGLLNVLDGVLASQSLMVIATTNHIERLDPALIRPGRFDVRVRLGNACETQARHLFLNIFCPDDLDADKRRAELRAVAQNTVSLPSTPPATPPTQLLDDDEVDVDCPGCDTGCLSCCSTSSSSTPTPQAPLTLSHSAEDELEALVYGRALYEQALAFGRAIPEPAPGVDGKPDAGVSMASLQAFLVKRKNQPARAVADVVRWVAAGASAEDEGPVVSL